MFLLNNYRQLEEILRDLPAAIEALQAGKTSEDMEYHKHLEAERMFLEHPRTETEDEAVGCEYVDILMKHRTATYNYVERALKEKANMPRDVGLRRKITWNKKHARDNLQMISAILQQFEVTHELSEQWLPNSEEWKTAEENLLKRDYWKALTKLEGLVIQRLFEIAKMGLSGTGYKMRMHINKSLKTCCHTIQKALKKYNAAAKVTDKPALLWKDVSTYESLVKFELLKESREDIRSLPWADSPNRQAAVHFFKIERAKEERERLNREIRRLVTYMHDEERDQARRITAHATDTSLPSLLVAAELRSYQARRIRVNNVHRARLERIFALPSFTGEGHAGTAVERKDDMEEDSQSPMHAPVGQLLDDKQLDSVGAEEDDYVGEQMESLNQWIGDLAIGGDEDE
ncbi:hypothetical protein FA95DRAFT_1578459 [Auriscalpium vulgare]|uniref:Uncharacterized protein n=1 Tax=Auriscalpium vulgare TaxID=40419 RepID=A0ACB8R295_9AGAM|nr:hypothetical protein FA95DRAFT_1578459 [Auriscalpium vulgare]